MDFASLATAAHDGTRALVHALTDEQQQHGDVENDDFAHLENLGGRSSLSSSSSSSSSSTISSSLKQTDDLGGVAALQQPPLLSPTAEAELLELATNFLLCESSQGLALVLGGGVRGRRLSDRRRVGFHGGGDQTKKGKP